MNKINKILYLSIFFLLLFIPSTFALFEFEESSKIETVFDAATGFMIPLIIYLSLNYGMNIYLFGSFIILAIADMGLTILFTYLCYSNYNDIFFWIYFMFITPIYIINYLLILKESNFFNKLFLRNDKREINKIEKYIKKRLIPLTLFIINLIFLGIAIHYKYVDFINGLFIIIPSILLFIVYFGFVILYDESKKKSNGLTHLRFFVEFMCSIIFVMITGPSVLWIKCYLSVTVVEMSLYLDRAKPSDSRYRLDNFNQFRDLLLNLHNNNNNNNNNDNNNNDGNNNNDNEKIKNFVIELHVNHKKEENNDIQILSLNVIDV